MEVGRERDLIVLCVSFIKTTLKVLLLPLPSPSSLSLSLPACCWLVDDDDGNEKGKGKRGKGREKGDVVILFFEGTKQKNH